VKNSEEINLYNREDYGIAELAIKSGKGVT
jgi:hypothetical protein